MEKFDNPGNDNPFSPLYKELGEIKNLMLQIIAMNGKTNSEGDDDLVDLETAAVILKKSKSRVYALINQRKIPFYKPSGTNKLFFSRNKLAAWIKSGEGKTLAEYKKENKNNGIIINKKKISKK